MDGINRRKYFRVYLANPLRAEARLAYLNGKQVSLQKLMELFIIDLSASGMKIRTTLKFPLEVEPILDLSFSLGGEKFSNILGEIVWERDKDSREYGVYYYGIRYTNLTEKEEQRLLRCLNKYQTKKVEHDRTSRESARRISPLDKVIEVMPFPSYLVLNDKVVCANKLARERMAYGYGELCYRSIFLEDRPCPFCEKEKARRSEVIVSKQVTTGGEKMLVSWLYLGDNLYLHWFERFEKNPKGENE